MNKSDKLFQQSKKHFPGGVNSPVRAFRAVGGSPKFIQKAKGQFVWDADGEKYLDFCQSWGPMILGHAHPKVTKAISDQAKKGTSYGAPTENESRLASLIKEAFPSIQKMRFTSSGTEAAMSAIRVARGFTKRKKIVKCDGCYHGHSDSLLVKAGSGGATFGVPDSAGVPEDLAKLTITIPYNNIEALEAVLKKSGKQIAAFIVEPVPANMGVILPRPGYLEEVRRLTKKYGVLLIFDEVITGFRIAFGGAQEYFGVKADLTCLGKIVGGGLPIGVFGGRSDIMGKISPDGPVYQAGTLSGNPLATAAGIATLSELKKEGFYRKLNIKSLEFFAGLDDLFEQGNYPVTLNRIGSMFTIFCTPNRVTDYQSAKTASPECYAQFFRSLLAKGIYFAPSQFEANFISAAMSHENLRKAASIISNFG